MHDVELCSSPTAAFNTAHDSAQGGRSTREFRIQSSKGLKGHPLGVRGGRHVRAAYRAFGDAVLYLGTPSP